MVHSSPSSLQNSANSVNGNPQQGLSARIMEVTNVANDSDDDGNKPAEKDLPVKVAVRVRPLLEFEKAKQITASPSAVMRFLPDRAQITIGKNRSFAYDFVFDEDNSQEEVHQKCVEPLIDYCFQGYNACVLAYGQTGSGKTYTMGSAGDSKRIPQEHVGIIPRVILKIFEKASNLPGNVNINLKVSFLELYNEDIRDMLVPNSDTKSLTIREDTTGNVYVQGLVEEDVRSKTEMENILIKGSLNRTIGSTNMNAVSSRSHAIFTIIILKNEFDESSGAKKTTQSRFHFVDLAGSERLAKTKAEGARMKEGISINSGLLALGNVISALGDPKKRRQHVPYRDSKLTRVLQDSLGGNSRTVMIACCSPAVSNFEETINTLKYADRARQIKNKPVMNVDINYQIEFLKLQKQVLLLQRELLRYKQMEHAGTLKKTSSGEAGRPNEGAKSEHGPAPDTPGINAINKRVSILANENQMLAQSLALVHRRFNVLMTICVRAEQDLLLAQHPENTSVNSTKVASRIESELNEYIDTVIKGDTPPQEDHQESQMTATQQQPQPQPQPQPPPQSHPVQQQQLEQPKTTTEIAKPIPEKPPAPAPAPASAAAANNTGDVQPQQQQQQQQQQSKPVTTTTPSPSLPVQEPVQKPQQPSTQPAQIPTQSQQQQQQQQQTPVKEGPDDTESPHMSPPDNLLPSVPPKSPGRPKSRPQSPGVSPREGGQETAMIDDLLNKADELLSDSHLYDVNDLESLLLENLTLGSELTQQLMGLINTQQQEEFEAW